MQQDFKWTPLPPLDKESMDAVVIQHERGVAPIVHEHYSDADFKKAQAEAQKAVRKYMPVKPLDRGRENLSNAVKQTMAEIEADLDGIAEVAKKAPRGVRGFTDTCVIVGAYQHPDSEMMYFIEWNDGSKEWLPAGKFEGGFDSLKEGLGDEKVFVWWGDGKQATLQDASKWAGVVIEIEPNVDEDADDGSLNEEECVVEVKYEDGDSDIINLQTLKFEAKVCADARKNVTQVCWMLQEHCSADIIEKVLRQCEGDESESDGEEEDTEEDAMEEEEDEGQHKLQPTVQLAKEPPEQQHGRSKRERKSVDRFDPQVEGKSDKEKKAIGKGKKQRKA